ncbi:MAG: WhiB family transcriptional regulator [Actinomycetota bacterium]
MSVLVAEFDIDLTGKRPSAMNAMDDTMTLEALPAPILDERPWAVFAACKDAKDVSFFPQSKTEERAAAAICAICPVREDCLEHALSTNERFGVWGGTSERQRRALQRAS